MTSRQSPRPPLSGNSSTVERYTQETQAENLGCANLFPFLKGVNGQSILDLGCGNGTTVRKLAGLVGAEGHVVGLDITPAMIDKAQEKDNPPHVRFVVGDIHQLPFEDQSFEVVISNCVINHAADKEQVYRELYRVLKPKGYFLVGDVMSIGELPAHVVENPDNIAHCWGGAIPKERYLHSIRSVGFKEIGILSSRQYLKEGYPMESVILKGFKRS